MDHVGNTGVVSSRRLAKNAPVNRSGKISEYYEVGSPSQVRVSISSHGKDEVELQDPIARNRAVDCIGAGALAEEAYSPALCDPLLRFRSNPSVPPLVPRSLLLSLD